MHETLSCSEFNSSPISSVSLPNLQVIFGSVDSSVLRNFDATTSLDSAKNLIENKMKSLQRLQNHLCIFRYLRQRQSIGQQVGSL